MSKNVNVNGMVYSGVSQIQLNTTDGITALFQDVDEIPATGGGGMETGTFVGDGKGTLTIPVSSQKSFLAIYIDDDWRTNVSDYPEQGVIILYIDNVNNVAMDLRRYSSVPDGTVQGVAKKTNTSFYEFSDNEITIKRGVQVQTEPFVSGKTYKWYAW